ncbi:alpha/beta fold hydrolase [Dactylosporangium sp. CS-033363]|uniref:alpha/beta fold hydrolase n=1 Tax=Dactylosporangium sp. CS-033363 TaxID=3239935 RepID=UPI003D8BB65A
MAYVRIGGVELYSEVAGEGEPVLLLHGGWCSLEYLQAQADALVADYRVFAFERPGHGRSADVDGDYSYARMVGDTCAYLDAVGLRDVHVVGFSDGAIIGLMLALAHPGRVRSLVAISANLDPSAFDLSDVDDDGDGGAPDPERLAYERLSPDGPGHADVVLEKLFRLWTSEPHIEPDQLARIAAPVLVMAADRDTIRPEHTLRIAASVPGAQLAIVPGTTHGLVRQKPGLVNTLIREFLGSIGAGATRSTGRPPEPS